MAQVRLFGIYPSTVTLSAVTSRLTEMARQYGDVYSLKVINSTVIVLSSTTAIKEVMEKNSAIVSDRPASHFAQEVTGGNHMGASRYSGFLWVSYRTTDKSHPLCSFR